MLAKWSSIEFVTLIGTLFRGCNYLSHRFMIQKAMDQIFKMGVTNFVNVLSNQVSKSCTRLGYDLENCSDALVDFID